LIFSGAGPVAAVIAVTAAVSGGRCPGAELSDDVSWLSHLTTTWSISPCYIGCLFVLPTVSPLHSPAPESGSRPAMTAGTDRLDHVATIRALFSSARTRLRATQPPGFPAPVQSSSRCLAVATRCTLLGALQREGVACGAGPARDRRRVADDRLRAPGGLPGRYFPPGAVGILA